MLIYCANCGYLIPEASDDSFVDSGMTYVIVKIIGRIEQSEHYFCSIKCLKNFYKN